MKFTKTIEELEDLIRTYEQELKGGYIGDNLIGNDGRKYNTEAITNMASAVEILKNNED